MLTVTPERCKMHKSKMHLHYHFNYKLSSWMSTWAADLHDTSLFLRAWSVMSLVAVILSVQTHDTATLNTPYDVLMHYSVQWSVCLFLSWSESPATVGALICLFCSSSLLSSQSFHHLLLTLSSSLICPHISFSQCSLYSVIVRVAWLHDENNRPFSEQPFDTK